MHVDHLVFAAGPAGLRAETEKLADMLGTDFKDGGFHPRFGTRNHIIPLADERYIEVVEVLDHPAAENAAYGRLVRARSEMGGGWMSWVISVPDIAPIEARLERKSVPGSRHFPDGRQLEWRQVGVCGTIADPQLPYFLQWVSEADVRPSALTSDVSLTAVALAGSQPRVAEWLAAEVAESVDGVALDFIAQSGQPGIASVTFDSPTKGTVRI